MARSRWTRLSWFIVALWVLNLGGLAALAYGLLSGLSGQLPFALPAALSRRTPTLPWISPTPSETLSPSSTPTASLTPLPTATPPPPIPPSNDELLRGHLLWLEGITSTPTLIPTPTAAVIGYSVGGRPLEMFTFGSGALKRLMVFGIHGGTEWNTVELADQLIGYLTVHPESVPAENTLFLLRLLNPDGAARGRGPDSRGNAHNVDLNRNWRTQNWAETWPPDKCWNAWPLNGGDGPGSEPETTALRHFILAEKPDAIVSYHSAALGILPGGIPPYSRSVSLAKALASVSRYAYPPVNTGCAYTGQFTDWAALQGIAAVDLELSDHDNTDFEENLKVLAAVLAWRK